MRSVNKVILIGNLTRDPEMRETTNNQKIATFGLATNRQWVTSKGEQKSSAEFHECVAWAKLAEICEKYLRKGKLIYVEGYLKTRSWDTEEGVKKFKTEIVVEDMIMLDKRSDSDDREDFIPRDQDSAQERTPEVVDQPIDQPATQSVDQSTDESTDTDPIDKDLGL